MSNFQLDQEEDSAQSPIQELKEKYKHTFKDDIGREVLADILVNFCKFGRRLEPGDIGEYNVGIGILSMLDAIYSSDGISGTEKVRRLLNNI